MARFLPCSKPSGHNVVHHLSTIWDLASNAGQIAHVVFLLVEFLARQHMCLCNAKGMAWGLLGQPLSLPLV
jgi:hypothetical protein